MKLVEKAVTSAATEAGRADAGLRAVVEPFAGSRQLRGCSPSRFGTAALVAGSPEGCNTQLAGLQRDRAHPGEVERVLGWPRASSLVPITPPFSPTGSDGPDRRQSVRAPDLRKGLDVAAED